MSEPTSDRRCGHCSNPLPAHAGRGRKPKYCGPSCATAAKRKQDRERSRPYGTCERCARNRDCRWDNGRYCSALCFGVAALVARGVAESVAERRIAALLAECPGLESHTVARAVSGPQEGFSYRSGRLLTAWGFEPGGYGLAPQETYLGGPVGPDEGRTCPNVPTRVAGNRWVVEHPDWWRKANVVSEPMMRVGGIVYPVAVLSFLLAVEATAKQYGLAA